MIYFPQLILSIVSLLPACIVISILLVVERSVAAIMPVSPKCAAPVSFSLTRVGHHMMPFRYDCAVIIDPLVVICR